MSLARYLREVTPDEHLLWLAWLDEQWEQPSRTDWYIMQTAAEARKGWVQEPNKVTVDEMRLRFQQAPAPATAPRAGAQGARAVAGTATAAGVPTDPALGAKLRWFVLLGAPDSLRPSLAPPAAPPAPSPPAGPAPTPILQEESRGGT